MLFPIDPVLIEIYDLRIYDKQNIDKRWPQMSREYELDIRDGLTCPSKDMVSIPLFAKDSDVRKSHEYPVQGCIVVKISIITNTNINSPLNFL